MRNLNNHDFNGRQLRVGIAAGEQGKEENKGAYGIVLRQLTAAGLPQSPLEYIGHGLEVK